tara:strand:- start:231 stop:467 length:237 start_codon:yes stop_codon:yes gene_type:complete
MAFKRYAVIELDPPESYSTGGMVIDFVHIKEGWTRLDGQLTQHWATKVDEYKLIEVEEDSEVKTGWIYTDKTHQFVAP